MSKKTVSNINIKQNSPLLWKGKIIWPDSLSNKYTRGHVLILGGSIMTGAPRLAAMAARRAGAGLVSIAAAEDAFDIYASATEPGTIITPFKGLDGFKKIILDKRVGAIVIGPGAGADVSGTSVEDMVLAAIGSGLNVVVDADGLNAFKENPEKLFKAIKASPASVVLTPHGGEFARLFPQLIDNSLEKAEITLKAAKLSGATVVFKGADTIIAGVGIAGTDGSPDYMGVVDSTGPAWLATAGSGDVLAGIIGAMLAPQGDEPGDEGGNKGMGGVPAACAAVWMQARAASIFGPGLVAEDIPKTLPQVWAELAR